MPRHSLRIVSRLLPILAATLSAGAQTWTFEQWATVDPVSGWTLDAGDFDADGRSDVVAYHPSDGSLYVGRSLASGSFTFSHWGNVSPASGWQIAAGEFTGDSRSDVVLYHPSDGTLTVGINQGSSFAFAAWGNASPDAGWVLEAGDFDGDGRSDVALYRPTASVFPPVPAGRVTVGINQNGSFAFSTWTTLSPAAGWTLDAGRFTGDARSDLLAYHPSDGSLWVLRSTGTGFVPEFYATLSPSAGWSIDSADVCRAAPGTPCFFEGDGLDDAVVHHPDDGTLWAGRNTGGGSFVFGASPVFTTDPLSGWTLRGGHFWRGDIGGVALYDSGGGGLHVSSGDSAALGYAWPLSAAPGERIEFMASGAALQTARFERHVSIANGVGPQAQAPVTSTEMGSVTFSPELQSIPPDAAQPYRTGFGWSPSFELVVPAHWPSGYYSARITGPKGDDWHMPFIVKPAPQARSRVALLANINTWNAYTYFGGASSYYLDPPNIPTFSFLRPSEHTSPRNDHDGHLTRSELWIHGFLESNGFQPDVYTDADLHAGSFLDDYDVLVIGTHPEYWTIEMFDHVQAFLAEGGSLLYLGGNGIFEFVRYVNDGTALAFHVAVDDPDDEGDSTQPRSNFYFRHTLPARRERSLLGMTTDNCGFRPGAAYGVLLPDHPLFDGLALEVGDLLGDFGLNTGGVGGVFNGKASGHEIDNVAGAGATAPSPCGIPDPTIPPQAPAPLPPGLHVIARAGTPAQPGSDMTYYRHAGGGIVLSVGSINFGGSLAVEPRLQQVVRNALPEPGAVGPLAAGAALIGWLRSRRSVRAR